MDSIDDLKGSSNGGFFKQVFNFDDGSKAEMLNVVQYAIIAFIPIVVLNKMMQKYVPEADEDKGSFELLAEVLIQIVIVFLGLLFINRIVMYVPTWSGEKYPNFSIIYIVLAVLMITLSLQTKLGEKVSILFDRVTELWDGKSEGKRGKAKGNGQVRVMQPLAGGSPLSLEQFTANTTSISQLPTESYQQNQPQQHQPQQQQRDQGQSQGQGQGQGQNYDNYGSGIMAANEALGGSSFGGTAY